MRTIRAMFQYKDYLKVHTCRCSIVKYIILSWSSFII